MIEAAACKATGWSSLCKTFPAFFALILASALLHAQEPAPTPVIVLNHSRGNFFVLASDLPFKVLAEEPEVVWLKVEPLEGEEIAHRVVQLESDPEGLSDGIYYSAIRVSLTTRTGEDHILIPVALRVGEDFDAGPAPPLESGTPVPQSYIKLHVDDPEIDLRYILTPGGHYIFEVIDKQKERLKLEQLSVSPRGMLALAAADLTENYDVVFPWMCLEYPCGSTTESDIFDVESNLDAVNHVSYERYSMNGGVWGVHNVGNPGPWAIEAGLGTWPMVTGGYNPPSDSIQAMWTNRATIVSQMISEAAGSGYEGYCIDVEGHADASTKMTFVNLVDYFADELHAHGFQLMVAHATWSTIAPLEDLATTSVDYVATMDPYTSLWYDYIPANYQMIEPNRLIWAFTWDRMSTDTQLQMWEWMQAQQYNVGVAGAAAWRTPLMPPHPDNDVDYYQGFRDYYPVATGTNACLATVPSDNWKGEYFDNKDLLGAPLMVRDDGNGFLDFDWVLGGPDGECGPGADRFSVRWTRSVSFAQGTHRFTVTSDDGARLYVDGTRVIDSWRDRGATADTVDVFLTVGDHAIVMEYYENGGYASARLSWEQISGGSCAASVASDRWKGEYYNNQDLLGAPLMVRDEGNGFLDFDWASGGPGGECGLGVDRFSVRWTRSVSFAQGRHRFTVTSDDGARLYVDGIRVIDSWRDRGATADAVDVILTAGDHTIVMEYYENGGYASARLSWEQISGGSCIASVASDRWKGEYYNSQDLLGVPLMVRDDGNGFLDFDWVLGGSGGECGLGVDRFSVRWTRTASFAQGTHRFTVTSDDGARLYVDGTRVIDSWRDRGATADTVDVFLTAGDHTIVMEYYENGGYASARLSWEQISGGSCAASVASDRWKGEYYNNQDLLGAPLMVRDEGNGFLDFDWASGGPGGECGLGVDRFSVRWTRTASFAQGTHRFTVTSDDGARLYIDGTRMIDSWWDRGATADQIKVFLAGGDHSIVFEYYENGGLASARLSWEAVSAPSDGWAFPVGNAATGSVWYVSNPLGNSWYSSQNARWYRGHLGEDWFRTDGDSLGEPAYAAAAGEVITVLHNCGNYVDVVIIEHDVEGIGEPIYSFYGHIEADGFVNEGDSVEKRQQIGVIGNPRPDFEPHLHFEIKNRTALTNPPFSGCSNTGSGVYISAGYSGLSDDYEGGEYYDPSDAVEGNRYYHPTRFIETHGDGGPVLTDCSSFVSDLNYPDGEVVSPGASLTKGWSLSNCGDTTWSAANGYQAVHVGGGYGPASFAVPTVGPGAVGDLWVGLNVPTVSGTHRATYLLEGPRGRFGDPFWIEIVVGEGPTTDCSSFVSDINYPDGEEVSPGQTIDKGWRLSNCGDTTWSTGGGYRAVRTAGSYGPMSFDLPTVGPGSSGDLYASITVPTTPGTHRATYTLEGPGGGFGDPFWVEIVVRETQTETIVDDGDSGFLLFGPSQYWHRELIGYGGDMYWTYVNGSVVSNKVQWRPQLAGAGSYKVQVFIPNNHATSRSARYSIRANGATYTATVDQYIYYDAWVTLGTFYFNGSNNGSEYVELTDATGEAGSTYREIGFDAVRWVNQ